VPRGRADALDLRTSLCYLSNDLNTRWFANVQASQSLTQTFGALGDPTRIAILSRLATQGDLTVQEIAAPFAMSLPAVCQHLKVLERAGLILRGRDGQTRPCRLNVERLAETARWFDRTRAAWEARLDRLEQFIAMTETKGDEHER
jgi:DNA-binding transcriptional ArsR family regulator